MSGYNMDGKEGKELQKDIAKRQKAKTDSMNHKPHYTQERLELAEERNSFALLLPYPCLLFRWQTTHPKDNMRIATIASHNIGKHAYCGDKCKTVERWQKFTYVTRIAEILLYQATHKQQQELL